MSILDSMPISKLAIKHNLNKRLIIKVDNFVFFLPHSSHNLPTFLQGRLCFLIMSSDKIKTIFQRAAKQRQNLYSLREVTDKMNLTIEKIQMIEKGNIEFAVFPYNYYHMKNYLHAINSNEIDQISLKDFQATQDNHTHLHDDSDQHDKPASQNSLLIYLNNFKSKITKWMIKNS